MKLTNFLKLMIDRKLTQKEKSTLSELFHQECVSLNKYLCIIDNEDKPGGKAMYDAMENVLKLARKGNAIFDWGNNCVYLRYLDEEREIFIVEP